MRPFAEIRPSRTADALTLMRPCGLAYMPLNEKQKKYLRKLAHPKKPVVLTGAAGITEPLLAEIDAALARHELIKVRINAADRDERQAMIDAVVENTRSELVQRIGHVAVLYRRAEKPQITLPK